MKNKVYIDIFNCSFYIYSNDERDRFEKAYCKVDDSLGITCGNGVWISNNGDILRTCIHEASHIVDWILEERLGVTQGKLMENNELRAYMLEFVASKIIKYIIPEKG